jgi:hypothetical protein
MTRRLVLSLLAAATLLMVAPGCSRNSSTSPALPELRALTVDEVAARLAANDGHTFVYDNNGQDSYAKAHLPGARWVDYDSVTAADLPPDRNATLIFYCHNEL